MIGHCFVTNGDVHVAKAIVCAIYGTGLALEPMTYLGARSTVSAKEGVR